MRQTLFNRFPRFSLDNNAHARDFPNIKPLGYRSRIDNSHIDNSSINCSFNKINEYNPNQKKIKSKSGVKIYQNNKQKDFQKGIQKKRYNIQQSEGINIKKRINQTKKLLQSPQKQAVLQKRKSYLRNDSSFDKKSNGPQQEQCILTNNKVLATKKLIKSRFFTEEKNIGLKNQKKINEKSQISILKLKSIDIQKKKHAQTLNDDQIDKSIHRKVSQFKSDIKNTYLINDTKYQKNLTKFQKKEIYSYKQLYFIGQINCKIEVNQQCEFNNHNGDYKIRLHDHIAYRYQILDKIGSGAFGQVIKVFDHKHKELGALKILANKKSKNKGYIELKILDYIKNADINNESNIIRLQNFMNFRNHIIFHFELLDINLYELIKFNRFRGFSLDIIRRFSIQILEALYFLQQHNIIHCDLKPQNIVLKKFGKTKLKLIDFGTSCFTNQKLYTYIQSRFYRSPEIILVVPYDTKIDMWSLGCILYELFTGVPLFPVQNELEQINLFIDKIGKPSLQFLQKGERTLLFFQSNGELSKNNIIPNKSQNKSLKSILMHSKNLEYIDFIEKCLKWDPEKRISPKEALLHKFIVEGLPESIKEQHLKKYIGSK